VICLFIVLKVQIFPHI